MHAHFSSCTSGVFDFSFHNSSRRVEKYRTTLRNINYRNFSFCYRRNLPSDDDAFLLYGCSYLDFLFCNPIWSTSNRPSSKTQNNSNKAFKTKNISKNYNQEMLLHKYLHNITCYNLVQIHIHT